MHDYIEPFFKAAFKDKANFKIGRNVEHDSGNEHKAEHGKGVRCDFFAYVLLRNFLKEGQKCLGMIGEVKPPKDKENPGARRAQLIDLWKLFRMMRDEITSQSSMGIKRPMVWGCQVFGYDMTFYVMERENPPLYTLFQVCKATLPKALDDVSSVGRIISIFYYIKVYCTFRDFNVRSLTYY